MSTDFADFGDITADELLNRQWEFFCDEVDDEGVVRFIDTWRDELKDLGPEMLDRTAAWVEWCHECLEIEQMTALFLGAAMKFLFTDYQDDWSRG